MLRDALEGAALAGRVAALEQHDHAQSLLRHVVLQRDEAALQVQQLGIVFVCQHGRLRALLEEGSHLRRGVEVVARHHGDPCRAGEVSDDLSAMISVR